jgi:glycosyltransferase involved in cell wall biosynthesis
MSVSCRIAIDLNPMSPVGGNGGIKHFILDFIQWTRGHAASRIEFIFIIRKELSTEIKQLQGPRDRILVSDRWKIPRRLANFFHQASGRQISEALTLSALSRMKPDIVYCPFGLVSLDFGRLPIAATIVDLLHVDYPQTLSKEDAAYRHRFLGETARKASLIHAISDYTQKRIDDVYPEARGKTIRAYLRPSLRAEAQGIPIGSTDATTKQPIDSFFFYPANFWKHKNHQTLLHAYSLYKAQAGQQAWKLVLTGDLLSKEAEFNAVVQRFGVQDSVSHKGYVSNVDMAQLWREAGALVFPSLHEGFGLPLVEAMQHHVPIICGRGTSLDEIAGPAACYVDAKDPSSIAEALLRISTDTTLRRELAALGARRFEERFAGDAEMERLLRAMLDLCQRSSRSSPDGKHRVRKSTVST